MTLDLGGRVFSSDGIDMGSVFRIILEPETLSVREIVVHQGVLMRHNWFVAAHHVDDIDDAGTVYLRLTEDEVRKLPQYVPAQNTPVIAAMTPYPSVRFMISQPGSVPSDAVILSRRTRVCDEDGRYLGSLDRLERTVGGRVGSIVLEAGHLQRREYRLPAEAIATIRNDQITLRTSRAQVLSAVPA